MNFAFFGFKLARIFRKRNDVKRRTSVKRVLKPLPNTCTLHSLAAHLTVVKFQNAYLILCCFLM